MSKIYLETNKKIRFLFYFISLLSFTFFLVKILLTRGACLSEIFFVAANDTYMDFFNSVYDVSTRRPYELGTIYPPLCYIIYYICNRFVPEEVINENWYNFPGGNTIKATQGGQLSFFLFMGIILIAIGYVTYRYLNFDKNEKIFALIVLFTSTPFLYSIERGNIILYSYFFAFAFIVGYKSQKRYIRELSYLCLAISAGLKIYPAILGLLLIREKRIKDALKCILYGIILFFVPFMLFGGISECLTLIDNIIENSISFSTSIGGLGYKVNFANTLKIIADIIHVEITSAQLISTGFSIILCITLFFQQTLWKQVTLLCLVIIGYPQFSYNYTVIFLLVPWLIFLKNELKNNLKDKIYALIFLIIFACFPLGILPINSEWPVTGNTLIMSLGIIIMGIVLISDTICELVSKRTIK